MMKCIKPPKLYRETADKTKERWLRKCERRQEGAIWSIFAAILGDRGDRVDQLDRRHEALESKSLGQLEVVADLNHRPARQLPEHRVDGVASERRGARFADHAVALGEWGGHRSEIVRGWVE